MARGEFLQSLGVATAPAEEMAPPDVKEQEFTAGVVPCVDLDTLRAMTEKTGRRWQCYFAEREQWPPEKRRQRLAMLSADIDMLHRSLRDAELPMEAVGWTVTPSGLWHRVGEEPPLDPHAFDGDAILALAREKGWPGLFAYGRHCGTGEAVWGKFVARAHPMWFSVAAAALLEYVNGALPTSTPAMRSRIAVLIFGAD